MILRGLEAAHSAVLNHGYLGPTYLKDTETSFVLTAFPMLRGFKAAPPVLTGLLNHVCLGLKYTQDKEARWPIPSTNVFNARLVLPPVSCEVCLSELRHWLGFSAPPTSYARCCMPQFSPDFLASVHLSLQCSFFSFANFHWVYSNPSVFHREIINSMELFQSMVF